MAVAVCGMHCTGMHAGTLICVADSTLTGPSGGGSFLLYAVFIFGVLLLAAVGVFYTLAIADSATPATQGNG